MHNHKLEKLFEIVLAPLHVTSKGVFADFINCETLPKLEKIRLTTGNQHLREHQRPFEVRIDSKISITIKEEKCRQRKPQFCFGRKSWL